MTIPTGGASSHWRSSTGLDHRFDALATVLARARPPPSRAAADRATPLHVPRATYRVQLNRDFTFVDATALVPYLAALGVSHVYCSPYLRARPGSWHGYDIVDHSELNPELGSHEDFERFVTALASHGMGHLCDVVPNHVGCMWADYVRWMVVGNGLPRRTRIISTSTGRPSTELAGRVLVPIWAIPMRGARAR
jgi:(1->4)-alpha-D-glucan 1-alpha-D-glucosylmutase